MGNPLVLVRRCGRYCTDALTTLLAYLVAREVTKEPVTRSVTSVPHSGTCDNPDYSTIPNRSQWRRCEWCCRAVRKDARHRCNEKLPVRGN